MKEINKSLQLSKYNSSKILFPKSKIENIKREFSRNFKLKITKNYLNNSEEMRKNKSLPLIPSNVNKLNNSLNFREKISSIVNEVKNKPKKRNKSSFFDKTSKEMSFLLSLKMFKISDSKSNIFEKKNIKKMILRDHGIYNSNEKNIIERSNKLYNNEDNIIASKKIKEELDKLNYSFYLKNNDFIYNSFEYLCKKCLDNYYLRKIKRNKKKAKNFLDEIYNLDCKEYEKLDLKKKKSLNNHLICYNNLNRKIRIHNLNKNKVDIDNDDLLNKNVKELKNRLKNINYEIYKIGNDITPKFVKKKLKDKTLKQYRGLNGVFFN